MREIKFRVWHKENKKMYTVETIDFVEKFVCICIGVDSNDVVFWNEVELMQYTGLLDKNNKEIYEGDIVNIVNYVKSKKNPYTVIYEYGSLFCKSKDDWICDFKNWDSSLFFEIIGNIYENPELLEEK